MRKMMHNRRMAAAVSTVGMFSCANIAMSVDASVLASILFAILSMGLRLCALLLALLNLLALPEHFYPKDTCTNFA